MATTKQRRAAKKNVRQAQQAARQKKTSTKLPKATRTDLGRQAAKSRQRGGRPGHTLEDRTRNQLYDRARQLGIEGAPKWVSGISSRQFGATAGNERITNLRKLVPDADVQINGEIPSPWAGATRWPLCP